MSEALPSVHSSVPSVINAQQLECSERQRAGSLTDPDPIYDEDILMAGKCKTQMSFSFTEPVAQYKGQSTATPTESKSPEKDFSKTKFTCSGCGLDAWRRKPLPFCAAHAEPKCWPTK